MPPLLYCISLQKTTSEYLLLTPGFSCQFCMKISFRLALRFARICELREGSGGRQQVEGPVAAQLLSILQPLQTWKHLILVSLTSHLSYLK